MLYEVITVQQKQRYRVAVGATAIISGTAVLTLASLPLLGWALVSVGLVAVVAGRPAS